MSDTTTTTKATRKEIAKRVYIDADGGESRNASPDAVVCEFRFVNGEVLPWKLSDFPQEILDAGAWHGLNQKLGDAFSAAKGDVALAFESATAMMEVLGLGTWVQKGSGVGAAPSMLLESIVRALTAKEGEEPDSERRSAIMLQLKDEETRKGALDDPNIAAEYAAIKAERAAEKAAKALAKAEESAGDESDALAGF